LYKIVKRTKLSKKKIFENIKTHVMKNYENGFMLMKLHEVEEELPEMLRDISSWNSLLVDYDLPVVERLWKQWGDFRIYLHRIHPCEPSKSLFHTHTWPAGVRILEGTYEMGVGYGVGDSIPPVAARMIMGGHSEYEMIDPDGWHYVRPIGGPTVSLMITGKPWDRNSPKSSYPLRALSEDKKEEIVQIFKEYYCYS
jgi:hypothetical protein